MRRPHLLRLQAAGPIRKIILDSSTPVPLEHQPMPTAPTTSGLSPQSVPPKDRPARPMPAGIAEILAVVSVLASYGRHLAQTLERRAVTRGFATIARFFGTVAFDTILAHITRGLMRAVALERILLHRAARGRDLRIPAPRAPSDREPPTEDARDTGQSAEPAPPAALTSEQDPAVLTPEHDPAAQAGAGS